MSKYVVFSLALSIPVNPYANIWEDEDTLLAQVSRKVMIQLIILDLRREWRFTFFPAAYVTLFETSVKTILTKNLADENSSE